MSEVNIAKRKEKCENCTKQCNKKQGENGANSQEEKDEVNGQVHEGSQLLLSACLSCDGCLSEEESLKISQQSLEEVERVLALNKVQYITSRHVKSEKVVLLRSTLHCPHCFCVPVRNVTFPSTRCS